MTKMNKPRRRGRPRKDKSKVSSSSPDVKKVKKPRSKPKKTARSILHEMYPMAYSDGDLTISAYEERKIEEEVRRNKASMRLTYEQVFAPSANLIHPIPFGKAYMSRYFEVDSPPFHWELGDIIFGPERKVAAAAPRGHAKTTFLKICLIEGAATLQFEYCLFVSDTQEQADMVLDAIKHEIDTNERLTASYPGLNPGRKWTAREIIFANGVRIQVVGAGKKIRGRASGHRRPDFILVDDLENDEMVEKLERRLKLRKWFRRALLPAGDPLRCRYRVVGTILHSDSLLSRLLRTDGWVRRIWRCMSDDGKTCLWPEYHPMKKLLSDKEEARRDGLLSSWYSEWMNMAFADEEAPFRSEDIIYFDDIPRDEFGKELDGFVSYYIDPAIGKKEKNDFSAHTVVFATHDGHWYVLYASRKKHDPSETLDLIKKVSRKYNPDIIGIEDVAFQRSLIHFLEASEDDDDIAYSELVEGITPDQDKRRRVLGLQPYFRRHRIHFRHGISPRLERELLNIDSIDHDDLADSLAGHLYLTVRPEPPKKREKRHNDAKSSMAKNHLREIRRQSLLKRHGMSDW